MKKRQSSVDADLQIYQENNTNNYRVVVNDRKDSKSANKIADSVKGAFDGLGECYYTQLGLDNVFEYTF